VGQKIARKLSNEFNELNYNTVHFTQRLKDYNYTSVSLAPDVILHAIEYPRGFDRETIDYLKSAFPPKNMREFIQSVPVNLYLPTIKKLEYILQPKYKSPPFDVPVWPPRELISQLEVRMRELLNRPKVRILWDHGSIESRRKHFTGSESYILQHAIEAWKNREFDFGDMEFILFSVLERAIPLTFHDGVLTFLCREEVPYYETRVPCKFSTEPPLLEVK